MDLKSLERPGVYVIYHVASGRSYVGSSVNVRVRRKTHLGALRHGRHYNGYLQRAWTKYGEDAFRFHVLEFVDRDDVLRAEQKWIDAIRPAFNLLPLAGSPRGFKLTAEQRAKISESNRRRMQNVTPERLEAMREHMRGIAKMSPRGPMSAEARANMSAAKKGKPSPHRGKPKSASARAALSRAMTGKKQSPEFVEMRVGKLRGKKRTPEQRAHIAAGLQRYHARKADTQPS